MRQGLPFLLQGVVEGPAVDLFGGHPLGLQPGIHPRRDLVEVVPLLVCFALLLPRPHPRRSVPGHPLGLEGGGGVGLIGVGLWPSLREELLQGGLGGGVAFPGLEVLLDHLGVRLERLEARGVFRPPLTLEEVDDGLGLPGRNLVVSGGVLPLVLLDGLLVGGLVVDVELRARVGQPMSLHPLVEAGGVRQTGAERPGGLGVHVFGVVDGIGVLGRWGQQLVLPLVVVTGAEGAPVVAPPEVLVLEGLQALLVVLVRLVVDELLQRLLLLFGGQLLERHLLAAIPMGPGGTGLRILRVVDVPEVIAGDGTVLGSRWVGTVQEIHDVVDRGVSDEPRGGQGPTLPEVRRLVVEGLGWMMRVDLLEVLGESLPPLLELRGLQLGRVDVGVLVIVL